VPDFTTGAMQEFGAPESRGPRERSFAGLVLLFADAFAELPAAFILNKERLVIGREDADITLPVGAVSRVHAEVKYEDGRWVLRDLGSRNGTLVDGTRIRAVALEPAAEIRIGDAILKFVDGHAEAFARSRLDGAMLGGAARRAVQVTEIFGGYQMDRVAAEIERIAPSALSVMLFGESGTGKEVLARELHRLSGRKGRFCAVNCAAIPASLIESELFGFKRGAFSGADRDKPGLIKLADEGTLVLDEIGDMPLEAQAKLLRVLQSKEVFPLGATVAERVDVRIVCATHRDLRKLQGTDEFRQDLFARLNEYEVRLSPLRERKEDVYLLWNTLAARHGRPNLRPAFSSMTGLLHYDWPYNVRELEACVKRAIALTPDDKMTDAMLPDSIREAMREYGAELGTIASSDPAGALPSTAPLARPSSPAGPDLGSAAEAPSAEELRALLERHQGNVAAVGRELGKARMQIHRWMKRHGIEVDAFRNE
jgi:transcriptional regulator with GAF, ATPase, and Fis domain